MNVGRILGRLVARAAAVGLAVGSVGIAAAADTPAVVAPAAPVVAGEVCPTCTGGETGAPSGKAGCRTCGGLSGLLGHLGHRTGCNGCSPKKPVVGELRPGACFGYFQTQWHRWDDVCAIPYQGSGLNDAPNRLPTAIPGIGAAPAPGAPAQPKTSNPLPAPKSDGTAPRSDAPAPKLNPVPTTGSSGAPVPPPLPSKFNN